MVTHLIGPLQSSNSYKFFNDRVAHIRLAFRPLDVIQKGRTETQSKTTLHLHQPHLQIRSHSLPVQLLKSHHAGHIFIYQVTYNGHKYSRVPSNARSSQTRVQPHGEARTRGHRTRAEQEISGSAARTSAPSDALQCPAPGAQPSIKVF